MPIYRQVIFCSLGPSASSFFFCYMVMINITSCYLFALSSIVNARLCKMPLLPSTSHVGRISFVSVMSRLNCVYAPDVGPYLLDWMD